ncbi:MAG: hypothetical protein ACLFM7_02060 [Bacteroidales bacterium]
MNKKPPLVVYVLWLLIGFQALQGLGGGLLMLLDPSGNSLRMPLIFLMGSPFPNYFVPGLILTVLLGVLPFICLIGLMTDKWHGPNILNIYKDRWWGWTFSLYVGFVLILWMDMQINFIGHWHSIQTFHSLTGVLILIFTLLPPVMKYYRMKDIS